MTARINAATLSHAVNGRPVVAGTLRRITSALLRAPRLEGADLLLLVDDARAAPPTHHGAAGVQTAPAAEGDRSVRSNPTRRTS